MNVRHIIEVFKVASRKPAKTPLGRWSINDSLLHTKLKINYANEDHCGTCSAYIVQKQLSNMTNEENEIFYQYMIGSESLPDSHIHK
jgi:ferredoxin